MLHEKALVGIGKKHLNYTKSLTNNQIKNKRYQIKINS